MLHACYFGLLIFKSQSPPLLGRVSRCHAPHGLCVALLKNQSPRPPLFSRTRRKGHSSRPTSLLLPRHPSLITCTAQYSPGSSHPHLHCPPLTRIHPIKSTHPHRHVITKHLALLRCKHQAAVTRMCTVRDHQYALPVIINGGRAPQAQVNKPGPSWWLSSPSRRLVYLLTSGHYPKVLPFASTIMGSSHLSSIPVAWSCASVLMAYRSRWWTGVPMVVVLITNNQTLHHRSTA